MRHGLERNPSEARQVALGLATLLCQHSQTLPRATKITHQGHQVKGQPPLSNLTTFSAPRPKTGLPFQTCSSQRLDLISVSKVKMREIYYPHQDSNPWARNFKNTSLVRCFSLKCHVHQQHRFQINSLGKEVLIKIFKENFSHPSKKD